MEELDLQVKGLALELAQLRNLILAGGPFNILAAINLGGSFPGGFSDNIDKQRTKKCKTFVDTTVAYRLTDGPDVGEDGTSCATYEITVTVRVYERCEGDSTGDVEKGTTTHVTSKRYCTPDRDSRTTGDSKTFDGKDISTITYEHGTKVTVTQDDETVTVEVEYQDGTSSTLVVD